jgi:hypothetical protein
MIADFYGQTVSVETFTGAGEFGDTYATAVTISGLLDDGLRLLTKGQGGDTTGDVVESASVFYCDVSHVAAFAQQSRVTANGNVMQVVATKRRQASLLSQVEHLEVHLS